MGRSCLVAAICVMAISCGGPVSVQSQARPGASASGGGALTGPYGLLLGDGALQLIKADGSAAATVSVGPSSVHECSNNHDGAVLAPPVSASNHQVYFRDGDTKIRMVASANSATDVTTVPGGANVVSFFSVSPDDQKIAVLVEDVSGASTISERLYVEDLHGGNHSDIYTTGQPKGKTGTTLWPLGWHQGALVLAVMVACTFEPAGLGPLEWHVSSAVTAIRMSTIKGSTCTLSLATSPAGVGCTGPTGTTSMYDWNGKLLAVTGPGVRGFDGAESGLSPAGQSIFFSPRPGVGAPPPSTRLVQLGPGPYATVQGHSACAWIDEDHVLATDAVIQFPAETPGNVQVNTTLKPLAKAGVCAGRFPGGL